MNRMLLTLVAVLTIGVLPANAHEQAPLDVRDRDWERANYWEDAQMLMVEGRLRMTNHGEGRIRTTCRLRLRLQEVEGDGVRHVREVVKRIWISDPRFVHWRAPIRDWGGKWRMARGERSVRVVHCHIKS
jgi:hypothetical protein